MDECPTHWAIVKKFIPDWTHWLIKKWRNEWLVKCSGRFANFWAWGYPHPYLYRWFPHSFRSSSSYPSCLVINRSWGFTHLDHTVWMIDHITCNVNNYHAINDLYLLSVNIMKSEKWINLECEWPEKCRTSSRNQDSTQTTRSQPGENLADLHSDKAGVGKWGKSEMTGSVTWRRTAARICSMPLRCGYDSLEQLYEWD